MRKEKPKRKNDELQNQELSEASLNVLYLLLIIFIAIDSLLIAVYLQTYSNFDQATTYLQQEFSSEEELQQYLEQLQNAGAEPSVISIQQNAARQLVTIEANALVIARADYQQFLSAVEQVNQAVGYEMVAANGSIAYDQEKIQMYVEANGATSLYRLLLDTRYISDSLIEHQVAAGVASYDVSAIDAQMTAMGGLISQVNMRLHFNQPNIGVDDIDWVSFEEWFNKFSQLQTHVLGRANHLFLQVENPWGLLFSLLAFENGILVVLFFAARQKRRSPGVMSEDEEDVGIDTTMLLRLGDGDDGEEIREQGGEEVSLKSSNKAFLI